MKIKDQTSDSMVLEDANLSGIVIGIIFIVLGLFLGYAFIRSHSSVIFPLVFVVAGVLILLLTSSILLSITKSTGKIDYSRKRLIGSKNFSYDISNALRIETRSSWRTVNSAGNQQGFSVSTPRQQLVSQSFLMFKDGAEIPLDHGGRSTSVSLGLLSMSPGNGKEVSIATEVATFLGIPFQAINPPSIGSNISGMNIQL